MNSITKLIITTSERALSLPPSTSVQPPHNPSCGFLRTLSCGSLFIHQRLFPRLFKEEIVALGSGKFGRGSSEGNNVLLGPVRAWLVRKDEVINIVTRSVAEMAMN